MVEDRGKKPKLSDAPEGETEAIDAKLILSVQQLQEIQDELDKINEDASDKVLEVEQKYSVIRKPIYDQRKEIIKSIPDFWLTAFLSHPVLGGFMTADDQMVFKHLTSLEVVDSEDVKLGYSISFYFSPNPYFEDSVLTKSFTFHDEGTKIKATSIKWKKGVVIPNGLNPEKKGKKRLPTIESFFSWFSDTRKEDMDEEEMNDDIADIIKEDLWMNPLTYFNNEDSDEDSDEENKEEEDSEEEDDDEEDDDEEDEDEVK